VAFTYSGFDGTVNELQAAKREKYLGLTYGFGGATDFKPTVAVGVDRTVRFAAGEAWAHHVLVTSDANVDKQAAVVASGSRWDTYVLRRNWSGAGGSATVEIVQGSSTKAVAGGLNSNPGVLDDQIICLARVTAGQSAIQEIQDLRTYGSKLILSPKLYGIKNAHLGMMVLVDGVLWRYQLDASNNPAWTSLDEQKSGTQVLTARSGWSAGGLTQRLVRIGNHVEYDLELRQAVSSPLLQFSSSGGLTDTTIADVVGTLPDRPVPLMFTFKANTTQAAYQCFGSLGTDGQVLIQSGPPNIAIYRSDIVGNWSVRAHTSFIKAVL
jgi:hypothetical protein